MKINSSLGRIVGTRLASVGATMLLVISLVSLVGCLCPRDAKPKTRGEPAAYFAFVDNSTKTPFVMKLTNPKRIREAREILAGRETRKTLPMGTIVKAKVDYNPDWSFSLDPESITFVETTVEVAASSIQMVENHLPEVGGAFLPGSRWCAWQSHLTKELYPDQQ